MPSTWAGQWAPRQQRLTDARMRLNDPNPYYLTDLLRDEWPVEGDYLWLPDRGTLLLTDVADLGGGLDLHGYACRGPIGDGVSWGRGPHDWIALRASLGPDHLFKILREREWPRLPGAGDRLVVNEDPPFDWIDIEASAEVEDGLWRVRGLLYDFGGQLLDDDDHILDIPLNRRAD